MNSELKKFKKLLKQCTSKDFDGHTEFSNLNASERLDWLAHLVVFTHEVKNKQYKNDSF